MVLNEIAAVADRCTLCKQAVRFWVDHYDLDEEGRDRVSRTLEDVPHSLFECKRMMQLNAEQWPLWV